MQPSEQARGLPRACGRRRRSRRSNGSEGRRTRTPSEWSPRRRDVAPCSMAPRMAALNPLTRELVFKIVFYGPGLGGKTTTLQCDSRATKPEHRGQAGVARDADGSHALLRFPPVPRAAHPRNLNVRLQLFTVPGQVYFSATRKLVLTGADGIVFVADSQAARMDANQESLEDLSANLAEHGRASRRSRTRSSGTSATSPTSSRSSELDATLQPVRRADARDGRDARRRRLRGPREDHAARAPTLRGRDAEGRAA